MIRRVARNAVWLGAGEAFVKGGLLVATVLIARGAGPVGVGLFSVAYSAAMVGVLVLALGQQEVLIREVARAPDSARPLLKLSYSLQVRFGPWIAAAAVVGALLVGDTGLRFALLAFAPYAVLRTATVTAGAAFKGLDRMDVEVRARALEVAIAVMIIAAGTVGSWPAWTAGAAFSTGSAVGLLWLVRRLPELGNTGAPLGAVIFLHQGLPFMALAVVSLLLAQADRFVLTALGVATAEIGQWGAAGTIVWALMALPQLAALAMYPSISRMAERGSLPHRPGLLASLGGGLSGLAVALALRAFAGPLVNLTFGPEFAEAVPLLQRLAWALPGAFALMLMGAVFAGWRRQTVSLGVMVGALATSVVLNLLWIPTRGVEAPALVAPLVFSAAALAATAMVLVVRPGRLGPT